MNKGQKRIEFLLTDKLKNLFYPVLENQREGGVESAYLIQNAKEHHLMQEHYFEALSQQIGKELCDAIAIPRLDRDNFDILKSIAIEVESPEEVRAHPDQVRANMLKNLSLFIKTEVWCYEESKDAIERIRDELGSDAMSRIDVIAVQKDGSK
jgi:rubrerythrin